jgi:hypothetical protein
MFVFACSVSTSLFGQNPTQSRGKVILPKAQQIPRLKNSIKTALLDPHLKQDRFKRPKKSSKNNTVLLRKNGQSPQLSAIPLYRNCFTVESEKKLREKYPARLSTEAFEQQLSARVGRQRQQLDAQTVFKIPTVVHVVNAGEPIGTGSNISREQIMSQFDVLNEDYRRIGGGYNEHPDGADINIEFVPALFDPQGNRLAEAGIDRVFGYSAYYEYDNIEYELKPNTIWDSERYFNIWVLNFGGSFSNYLGYAQFPSFSGLEGLPDDGSAYTDGVVIGYQYFGRTGNVVAPFNLGRTTSHEVGHWLGLRHIWGDGDCSVDDFCTDTPNADGPNRSCDFRDSCPEDGPDMIENYMDYTTDGCMNVFTNDQKFRMRTVLELSPRRNSLLACQQAPLATIGTNISDKAKAWFEYTATENQVVTVSSIGTADIDTRLSFYETCNALPMIANDNSQGTLQSIQSVGLQEGETIKILWESDEFIEPFEWTLTIAPQTAGAACDVAVEAVQGSNSLPTTSLSTYWYKFSPATDHQKIVIDGQGKNFTVYGNNCHQLNTLKTGSGAVTVYDISASDNIYVAFEANGGSFDWTLNTSAIRQGETCSDAVVAMAGENTIPYAAPFAYWYSYTIPFDGQVVVRTDDPGEIGRFAIYKECAGIGISEESGAQIQTEPISLHQGETIKIVWDATSGIENFTWSLESTAYENGEICSIAKVAQAGLNHTDAAPRWFTFTTTKRTNLKISSVGLTDVDTQLIIKRECDGLITADNDNDLSGPQFSSQSKLILYDLDAGEKIYILWSEKWTNEGFDWVIEEVVPLQGDNCSTAKRAVVGTNTLNYRPDHDNFGNIFWTRFVVPESGKKITAFASEPVDMAIYTHNNCQTFNWIAADQGKAHAFNLDAGTEVLIIWDVDDITKDVTWQLSVEDIVPGDLCTSPIHANKGENTASETPIWYDYVMTQPGNLKISYGELSGNVIPHVALLDGCGDEANIIFQGGNTAFVSGLPQGQRVLIYLTVGYPFPAVDWTLEEIPLKQGDTCADPIPATYGLNHAEYATQWFSYTPETAGSVKISSRAFTFSDTELYVYDACDGNLLAQNGDIFSDEDFVLYFQSELVLENIEAGQTLLIKWAGTYSFEPFDWEITNDLPRKGDSCDDPLTAVEGVNNGMKPAPAWFSFTMPRTASLSLSTLGYTDQNTNVEIYDECNGTLIASNDDLGDAQSFVHIDELQEGQTVLIRWANGMASEHYTFDWKLWVGDPDPGLVCQFPAEAQVGVNTTPAYISNYYWFKFTMPEDDKKLVIKRSNSSLNIWRTVGVTSTCDRSLDYGVAEDRVTVNGLNAGEQVLIFWGELTLGERPGFGWELLLEEMSEGDVCALPIEATTGTHHATGVPTWYHYTMPFDGNVKFSSVGINDVYTNTYVEIYDACDGNLIASNDNPEDWSHFLAEVVLENVDAGQSFWIKWATSLPFQIPFDWKVIEENPNNHAPTLADASFHIASATNGQVVGTLVGEDEDGDGLEYSITDGNDDGAFALHAVTGVLSIVDAAKFNELTATREMHVSVSDYALSADAIVTFNIVTSLSDENENTVKAYPNPATDKLYIELPESYRVQESYIVDVNGSVVKRNDPMEREISVAKISQGIYFLKLRTDKSQFTIRIALLK